MTIATTFTSAIVNALFTYLASHTLKVALIKTSPTGTYGKATTNYSDLTGNSDEVTGAGYTAGGATLASLTVGQGGTDNSVTWLTFTNPAWAAATFNTRGALIYDTSDSNRAVATIDFGENKTIVAGTFTLTLPTPDAMNAGLRFSI